jgi:hypothetical protein
MHPTSLAAMTTIGRKTFNRLVVHVDSTVMTYSLDILARVALDKSQVHSLDASIERVGGNDVNIVLCRHVHFNKRALRSYIFSILRILSSSPPLVIYGSKRRLGTSVMLHVVEALDSSEAVLSPTGTSARAFRPLGEVCSLSNHICSRSSLTLMRCCVAWLCTKGCLRHRPTCEHNRHLHKCRYSNSRSNKVRSFS